MSDEPATIEQEAAKFWAKYFCQCGDSEAALEAFKEIMGLFAWRHETDSYAVKLDRWEAYGSKHGEGLAWCVLYWIEGMGLTEHGGNTIGSWMTDLGAYVKNEVENGTPEYFQDIE